MKYKPFAYISFILYSADPPGPRTCAAITVEWPCTQPPLIAGLNFKERQRLHHTARAHKRLCEWAVGRLRAELLRTVVRCRFQDARRRSSIPASSGGMTEIEAGAPPSPFPAADEEEDTEVSQEPEFLPPSVGGGRKRTRWQEHFPWQFVSPQALNSRGEPIFYRVDDDQDQLW
jgi:hypothetical protein